MGRQYLLLLGQKDTGQRLPWKGTGGEHESLGSVKVRAPTGCLQLILCAAVRFMHAERAQRAYLPIRGTK